MDWIVTFRLGIIQPRGRAIRVCLRLDTKPQTKEEKAKEAERKLREFLDKKKIWALKRGYKLEIQELKPVRWYQFWVSRKMVVL